MILILTASSGKNLELAHQFQSKCTELNMRSEIINLVELNLPLYSPLTEAKHSPVEVLGPHLGKIKEAVGFVFLSPEYNGGVPPVMTNFVAWVSRSSKVWREAFNTKPAIIGTFSAGNGLGMLTALRSQLAYLGITIIGRQIVVSPSKAVEDSALLDVCSQLKKLSYL
jgi:chromate reductase, NAD(P)H dehydrogenase (quinone)